MNVDAGLDHQLVSKQGRWQEMGVEFAVVGEPHEIVPEVTRRYGAFSDRTSGTDRTSGAFPFADPDARKAMIAELRG